MERKRLVVSELKHLLPGCITPTSMGLDLWADVAASVDIGIAGSMSKKHACPGGFLGEVLILEEYGREAREVFQAYLGSLGAKKQDCGRQRQAGKRKRLDGEVERLMHRVRGDLVGFTLRQLLCGGGGAGNMSDVVVWPLLVHCGLSLNGMSVLRGIFKTSGAP